jgi:hypothetical protein
VISLSGFSGLDPVFTTKKLADLVNEGAVRFFLIPDKQHVTQMMPGDDVSSQQPGWQGSPTGATTGATQDGPGGLLSPLQNGSERWVQDNCKRVPHELWQSSTFGQGGELSMNGQALYDCGAGRR